MTQEELTLVLEALKWCHGGEPCGTAEAIAVVQKALAQEQEPVAHSVIAGVLFDFMGWLTSRKERIVLSSADNASPAVEAITEFAKMRNLSLDDAKVQDWNTSPPQRSESSGKPAAWVGLTNNDLQPIAEEYRILFGSWVHDFARAIEAKLKEKNNG